MPDPTRHDDAFASIRSWILTHLGLVFDGDRGAMLAGRLHTRVGSRDLTSVSRALSAGDEAAIELVVELAATNHTYFFREPEAFRMVAEQVAPTLPTDRPVRVWSAATSSGEEAYSLAITLAAAMPRASRRWLRVLGTDVSAPHLATAERGEYPATGLRRVPAAHLACFASCGPDKVRVVDEIRASCQFRRLNLTALPWPFEARFDVIFLRNVLYYFAPAMRHKIVDACFDVAAPGGWMFIGGLETLLDQTPRWQAVRPGVYRRPRSP